MSYIILIHPDHCLPTLISSQDLNMPSFITKGYIIYDRGWRWEMEKRMEELTEALCLAMGQ